MEIFDDLQEEKKKRHLVNQMETRRIGYKPGLPMVKKRLMANGIITRMESSIKNKENSQFISRVLVQIFKNVKKKKKKNYERLKITHVAEKISNAWSMSKKNIMQLSVKHHENMIRETAA